MEEHIHEPLELTDGEVALILTHAAMRPEARSPLIAQADPTRFEADARALAKKGLVDRRDFRPGRDLLRRMLVVAQPDSRLTRTDVAPEQVRAVANFYERAGVWVEHRRSHGVNHLGPVLEAADVVDELVRGFSPRRSSGDFVRLELDSDEAITFALLAQAADLGLDWAPAPHYALNAAHDILCVGHSEAPTGLGTRRLSAAAQERALQSLEQKGICLGKQRLHLKPFLRDLGAGLAARTRTILARNGAGEPKEASLLLVPGSLFWLTLGPEGGAVVELDRERLGQVVQRLAQ